MINFAATSEPEHRVPPEAFPHPIDLFHDCVNLEYEVTTHQVITVYRHYLDVLLTARMKGNFITAEDTSSKVTGLPLFARTQAIPDSGWRPRGVLVAHLQEHGYAVNDIAISTDHYFFISASEDCTVKVWDSRKLEKDISFRSRLTCSLEGS
ncbi:hypothetical protein RJ640_001270 [Escallonia rubra]|uniref:Uncharacterized protein n=1 Tax=Escallonia rubra TaxID=112253 RepID=A0AA88URF4_9ASTE|nr:hypothetical protein RJ640_001270 [Escallonia rubra]